MHVYLYLQYLTNQSSVEISSYHTFELTILFPYQYIHERNISECQIKTIVIKIFDAMELGEVNGQKKAQGSYEYCENVEEKFPLND